LQFIFVHISKTGGASIEEALGLRKQHLTARGFFHAMGQIAWESHFTFSIVRNPWDRVVSHYAYRVRTNQTGLGDGKVKFAEWVREAYGRRNLRFYDKPMFFMPQMNWISGDKGEILVSFVGRFERLQADFDVICTKVGRTSRALPHLNRSDRANYRSYYDDEARQIVGDRFRSDVETFGYSF
jgi:hypothetical protein